MKYSIVLLTFKLIMMTTTVHWAKILAKFWPKSAIMWVIIGEFDNLGQI